MGRLGTEKEVQPWTSTLPDDPVALADYKRMEPLWSPVVATGGRQSQIRRPQEPQKHAKTVAVGCHRLPEKFHGKEGVDGSSPSEGFEKPLQIGGFFTHGVVHVDGPRSHQVAPIDGTRPTPLHQRLDRDLSLRKRPWIWFMRRIAARPTAES
jgi:hypothetical protein